MSGTIGRNLSNVWLRICVAIILFMHSIPGMLSGDIQSFGKDYLDKIGFAPFGVFLAWNIKLVHVFCIVALLTNIGLYIASSIMILILVLGIIMVHGQQGWYVVGGGTNGMEFNLLLIAALIQIMADMKHSKKQAG